MLSLSRVASRAFLLPVLLSLACSGAGGPPVLPEADVPAPAVDLSPSAWEAADRALYAELDGGFLRPEPPSASSRGGGLVATIGQASAARAGVEALRRGGSAMDAALTAALTQIALDAGATVSYAGILSITTYDAATGTVWALNAPFRIPRGETDPLIIPAGDATGGVDGRSVLVPGFMTGVEAAHRRFGRLPWASLFGPAIHAAEEGWVVNDFFAAQIEGRRDVLLRLPGGREVFLDEAGEMPKAGARFRQPALARTLRRVAERGAGEMTHGTWARELVETVRAEGGTLTLEDLAAHAEITWHPALSVDHGAFRVHAPGPGPGGAHPFLASVAVLNAAAEDLAAMGHYSESAEAFYHLTQISRVPRLVDLYPHLLGAEEAAAAGEVETLLSRGQARSTWERIRAPGWLEALRDPRPRDERRSGTGHSDAVVAADAAGNVVALIHSINTVNWGRSGIFVGGISIPDPGAQQQQAIARDGAGHPLRNVMNPVLVTRDGEPAFALAGIGRGLYETTLEGLHNMADHGMTPGQALAAPIFHAARLVRPEELEKDADGLAEGSGFVQAVTEGDFPEELLLEVERLGQPLRRLSFDQQWGNRGFLCALAVDPETGTYEAATSRFFNGWVVVE